MIVEYTSDALADLDLIWDWNSQKYGGARANAYLRFLQGETDRLSTEHARGRAVPTAENLRYRMIRKKKRGHGHVVIYEAVGPSVIRVLRYFHTAQDWQNKVAERSSR